MTEVHVSSGAAREQYVADRHDLFGLAGNSLEAESSADDSFVHRTAAGEGRLLTVIGDGNPEGSRVLESSPHHVRACDGFAVVADRDGSRTDHLAEFRQGFATLAH